MAATQARIASGNSDEIRKAAERRFHNDRFGAEQDVREPLDRWYGAVAACDRAQKSLVERYGAAGDVLEYGCADARVSLERDAFTDRMARFHGIDISDRAIEAARRAARLQGRKNCRFGVMDAEQMTFPSATFDVVFGSGILHHLDLERAFGEIARVLKPGGKAVFSEPLGHNPLLNAFRRATPTLRTADEHPLLMRDLELARRFFRDVAHTHFGLTTLLAVPFQQQFADSPVMRVCEMADRVLLRLPLVRQNAWFVLLVLTA